jgi:hypothetical protein
MAYVAQRLIRFLVALTAAVTLTACGGGGDRSGPESASAPASLAAASLLPQRTQESACAAFTSGKYRLIEPAPAGTNTVIDLATVTIDNAGTPKITLSDHSSQTLTPGAAPCSFTAADGSGVVVSPAAVVLMSKLEGDGRRYPVLLFPEQRVPLRDLAGTWNQVSWERPRPGDALDGPYTLNYGTFSFDTAGNGASGVVCSVKADLSGGCNVEGGTDTLVVNPAGGYSGSRSTGRHAGDLTDGERLFAYKNGTDIMIAVVTPHGSLTLATPQAAIDLPAVGTTNSVWNLNRNSAGALTVAGTNVMPGIATLVNTVTSVDALNSVVVRDASQDGAAAISQTLHYNVPLAGFRKRDGATNVSAAILLTLRGMGLTAVSRLGATTPTTPGTGNGFMGLSVDMP